ncbi:DUF1294 domain-containing protein [Cupriavidus necator]
MIAGLAALELIFGGAFVGYFPRQAGIVSLLASVVTFFAYADDKTRASRNAWRTPETTLHLLALCGGWPGALACPAAASTQEPEAGVSSDVLGHCRRERCRNGSLAIRYSDLRKGKPKAAADKKALERALCLMLQRATLSMQCPFASVGARTEGVRGHPPAAHTASTSVHQGHRCHLPDNRPIRAAR